MTKVFISYSHRDELYKNELEKHLSILKRNGDIDTWTDSQIVAGENWEGKISEELLDAKIILLLISPDFLASNYCYEIEMKTAIRRHSTKEAVVIPIILRHCDWENTPFSSIQALPVGGNPVKAWNDQDQAFLNVVKGIKILLKSLNDANIDIKNSFFYVDNSLFFENYKKEKLSQIYEAILMARSARELRKVKFDLEKYKHLFSPFEIEELEMILRKSIEYEEFELRKYKNACPAKMATVVEALLDECKETDARMPAKTGCTWIGIIVAIIIVGLIYFIVRLFI